MKICRIFRHKIFRGYRNRTLARNWLNTFWSIDSEICWRKMTSPLSSAWSLKNFKWCSTKVFLEGKNLNSLVPCVSTENSYNSAAGLVRHVWRFCHVWGVKELKKHLLMLLSSAHCCRSIACNSTNTHKL